MHILIGLSVATVILILWARGNLFACVFLSISIVLVAVMVVTEMPGIGLICVLLLAGIWAPRYYLGRRERTASITRPVLSEQQRRKAWDALLLDIERSKQVRQLRSLD